jgi:hypothetical protein
MQVVDGALERGEPFFGFGGKELEGDGGQAAIEELVDAHYLFIR